MVNKSILSGKAWLFTFLNMSCNELNILIVRLSGASPKPWSMNGLRAHSLTYFKCLMFIFIDNSGQENAFRKKSWTLICESSAVFFLLCNFFFTYNPSSLVLGMNGKLHHFSQSFIN